MTADEIQQLIDKLTPAAKQVYELALRQVFVNLITSFTFLAISVIVAVGTLMYTHKKKTEDNDRYSDWELVLFFNAFVGCAVVGFALVNFLIYAGAMLNPEWAAIKMIIDYAK